MNVFMVLGEISNNLLIMISNAGGLISPFFTKQITHVLVDKSNISNFEPELTLAQKSNVPVLDMNLLLNALSKSGKISLDEVVISVSLSKGSSKNTNGNQTNSYSNVSTQVIGEGHLKNSEWMGIAANKSTNRKFPIVMTIFLHNQVGKFWGQLKWPTRENSITKINGQIADKKIMISETNVIAGDSSIFDLPCGYEGIINDKEIKVDSPTFEFQLNLIGYANDLPFPFLKAGTTYDAMCTERLSFDIQITSKKEKKCDAKLIPQRSVISPAETAIDVLSEHNNILLTENDKMEEINFEITDQGKQYRLQPDKSKIQIFVNK